MKEKIDIQRITNPAWQRPAIITLWSYAPTGLLTNKVYADGKGTAYTYTPDGKLASRLWARGVTTSYTYTNGSSLVAIDYSDNTPDVAFTYDRLGRQVSAIVDGVSTNTYTYDSETLALSVETQNGLEINRTTDALGLDIGFSLGSVYGVQYGYDTYGRFSSLRALAPLRETNTFTYSYLPNTDLLSGMSASSGFLWTRAYESGRSLITSVENSFGETVISRYNYTNDELGRRTSRADSGLAFAAQPTYGDSATVEMPAYNAYSYNTRSEVTGAARRWGTPDAPGALVLGQQYAYAFDSIGNRTTAAEGDTARTASYTANALNQYSQRTVPDEKDLIGTAPTNVAVTVNQNAASRQSAYWHHALEVVNSTEAAYPQVAITAVYNPPGTNDPDVVTSTTGCVFVAQTPESFQYDSDGNLTQDGRFTYTWDGENRMIGVTTRDDLPAAVPRVNVDYIYDHQSRRIASATAIWTNDAWQATESRAFLYDGWNVVQETINHQPSTTNYYTWGLDLSGTLQGAGGIGGLLATSLDGTTAFYCHDANGNVGQLVDADSAILALYEYSPFGETVVSTGPLAKVNPFRFSTKWFDNDTGLGDWGYRWYSPGMGRWLSRDPIEEGAFAKRISTLSPSQFGSSCCVGQKWSAYLKANHELLRIADKIGKMESNDISSKYIQSHVSASEADKFHLYLYVKNSPIDNYDPYGLFPADAIPGIPAVPFPLNLLPPCSGPASGKAADQDGICSFPGGEKLNKCYQACCKKHDDCYTAHNCNKWSWINGCGSMECKMCNIAVSACFAIVKLSKAPCCDEK